MKKVEAYIQHRHLPDVVQALENMHGFPGLTVLEILGHGAGAGTDDDYRLSEQSLSLHRRNLVQVVIDEALLDEVVAIIRAAAQTGSPGDGMILVTSVDNAMRIRTGEPLTTPLL